MMIRYQQATLNDLEIINEMESQCFNSFDRFPKKNLKRMLLNPNQSVIFDLILYMDKIAGYSIYLTKKNSQMIRLYSICVLPDYAGNHIGKIYLQGRLDDFAKQYSEIYLEVRESNTRAIHLYTHLGFKAQKTLPAYYADGENGLYLKKKLK